MLPRLVVPEQVMAYRFSGHDHCRLALLSDPAQDGASVTLLLEIHDPADRVPPHRHHHAAELFFVLRGRVCFHVEDDTVEARTGDCVVVPAGAAHDLENPGPERLYLLTVLSRDEGFAESLRRGIPTPMQPEDLQVLRSL